MHVPLFWQQRYVDLVGGSSSLRLVFDGNRWLISPGNEGFSLLTLNKSENAVHSPAQASYGGILKTKSHPQQNPALLSSLTKHLISDGVSEFHITLAPEHLTNENLIPSEIYLNHGFTLKFENISHYIEMKSWNKSALSKGNRKKLKQSGQLGLIFEETPESERKSCYNLIEVNRLSLGAKVSVSFSKLIELMSTFPDKYFMYQLRSPDNGEIAATAVLVETSPENLYVYLWADSLEFRSVSPIVFLLEGLIEKFSDKYNYLDLGTSAIDGDVLEGLARFKDNLGATRTNKKTVLWINPTL